VSWLLRISTAGDLFDCGSATWLWCWAPLAYTRTFPSTHTHTLAHTHIHLHPHTHTTLPLSVSLSCAHALATPLSLSHLLSHTLALTHTYAHTHTFTYTHTHTHTHAHTFTFTYTHTYTSTHSHIHQHTYTYAQTNWLRAQRRIDLKYLALQIRQFSFPLFRVTKTPVYQCKNVFEFLGNPVKNCLKVTGTQWKLVWNFGSRNYLKSDLLRPWHLHVHMAPPITFY